MSPRFGAVLLAGGSGRRMEGREKVLMAYRGGTFAEYLAAQLGGFGERLYSASREGHCPAGFALVRDNYPGCGPMAGLQAALSACHSDALLAVACDMPRFEADFGEYLCARFTAELDALIPVDTTGRVQPLCAVYAKGVAGHFKAALEQGDFRLMRTLRSLRVAYLPMRETPFSDDLLTNINTPEEYAAFCAGEGEEI